MKEEPYELVILDRDGVINHDSDAYIRSVEEWIPIERSIESIARLCKAGIPVAIATNQSGLARGYFSLETLEAMHERLRSLVKIAGGEISHIAYCPHGPDDNCRCRKPLPGLLEEISEHIGIPLSSRVLVVGDSLRDLEAGMAVGCSVALVRTGKGASTVSRLATHLQPGIRNAGVHDSLHTLVRHLLAVDVIQGSTCPS